MNYRKIPFSCKNGFCLSWESSKETGRHEIFFRGTDCNYTTIYEKEGSVSVYRHNTFELGGGSGDILEAGASISNDEFLAGLGEARINCTAVLGNGKWNKLTINGNVISFESQGLTLGPYGLDFDDVFFDSFSVIENSEPRKRQGHEVAPSYAGKALIEIISSDISIFHYSTPRAFEVFVASLLTNRGFSKVRLLRFSRDGGVDIFAVYCEGDYEYTIVVEVKRYAWRIKVGRALVDRLNGVRDRENADLGMVVTSSSFTIPATRHYFTRSSRIALVDFQTLEELLGRCDDHWTATASGLWTLPTILGGTSAT